MSTTGQPASDGRTSGITLVTGATGFLGRHLVQALIARQQRAEGEVEKLRLLTTNGLRPQWLALDADVDVLGGSLLEREVVRRAVDGARRVYHLAGRVSRHADDSREMYAVHVDGTRLLCEEAQRAGVARVVMASTSGTIAVSEHEGRPDERAPVPRAIISRWPYYASKLYQEEAALTALGEQCATELVVLNPSLLLGPGDERLSSTGDVLKFLKQDIPLVPSGGLNFVDVRDAAEAFLSAMERGRHRERYLLGGPNWPFAEFFGRLERITKVSRPRFRLPDKLALAGAWMLDEVYRRLDRVAPVDYASVEMSTYYWYLDDSKARAELGFATRDPSETLWDTVSYLRQRFNVRDDSFAA